MATAVIAGLSVAGAIGGGAGIALGIGAAMMTAVMERQMQPDAPSQTPVQVGDRAQAIDKSRMQEEADVGKLKLGEETTKKKRAKGKAAYKIELDKSQKAKADAGDAVGVQTSKPQDLGVQL